MERKFETGGRVFTINTRQNEDDEWFADVNERSVHTGPGGGPEWTAEWESSLTGYGTEGLAVVSAIREIEGMVFDHA